MKTCPYCAEPIQESAVKCRYCGSNLRPTVLAREWYRSRRGKKVAGVCAGLAEELGIPITPIRLAFVLLTLIGGPGLVLYIILWLVMPYRDEPRVALDQHGSRPLDLPDEAAHRFLDRG